MMSKATPSVSSQVSGSNAGTTLTDRVVELVTSLATGAVPKLVPERSIASPVAYTYAEAARILGVAPGEEIATLDALEDRGVLAAEPVTTVPVCPFCRTYPLRVERACQECGSTAVHRTTMIHHYRCGNVSPEETYRHDADLVCPKCNHKLRHIGVDYERPSGVWLCDDCHQVSDAPELRYHSLTCDRRVPLDDVVDRQLSAYTLSPDGAHLVSEGTLRAAIERPDVSDSLTGLPGAAAIDRALQLEQTRAERYGTKFALVRFHLSNGPELGERFGEEAVSRVVKTLATIARENLRTIDAVGRSERYGFLAVLPETDSEGARVALSKLTESAQAYMHGLGRDEAHRAANVAGEIVEPTAPKAE
ncbi:MAG: diguanylate cyclase [Actinobacteria bacterium]|nr:diguanylate cyclase [Actinomycetota bacterium]